MDISKQVCSLEQANKLKELGVVQHSLFLYANNWRSPRNEPIDDGQHIILYEEKLITRREGAKRGAEVTFSPAFTVAELGTALPCFFPSFVQEGHKHCHCRNERVDTFPLLSGETEYDNTPAHILNKELIPIKTGETEAVARANMLIFLIEENLIKIEDVNERLSL